MTQAIIVPYTVDQNEPSRPIRAIVDIPNDQEEREQVLVRLFTQHVFDPEFEPISRSDLEIREGSERDYGDVIVSYGDSIFMYVTLVE